MTQTLQWLQLPTALQRAVKCSTLYDREAQHSTAEYNIQDNYCKRVTGPENTGHCRGATVHGNRLGWTELQLLHKSEYEETQEGRTGKDLYTYPHSALSIQSLQLPNNPQGS
jgi:hypothetical protein